MRVDVEEFGCVPDGRILDPVEIAAASPVLSAPRGGLRGSDAGKNVAIPGAVDLVETIAALVERREVRDARIELSQPDILAGTLFNPANGRDERFLARVHVGRRITVAGAGPEGQVLVTDVVEVLDGDRIRLGAPAAAAVVGVEVILNRPDVVSLGDYARRAVSGLTLDLGDRTVDDAGIALGARGLTSEAARFSSEDLGTGVTIPAAGLFMTTIAAVDSPTSATLTAPAERSIAQEDGIPADVWRTDSRPGLERLLAAIRSFEVEATAIRFGPGIYDFTREPLGGPTQAAIPLAGLRDVTIAGAGSGTTVLRLMPGQRLRTDSHVIEILGCKRLTVRDLSVHGSYLTLAGAVEHMHGIHVVDGSEEIAVLGVRVFQAAGDGINLLGRAEEEAVRNVWVQGCRLDRNKRSGVGFQRGVAFVWVRDCYVEMTPPSTDQCIDFEPSGLGEGEIVAPHDVFVESNVLVHESRGVAVAIEGVSGADPARRIAFAGNHILGGEIFATDVAELTIRDNVVEVPASTRPGSVLVNLQRGGDTVLIQDNVLVSAHPETVGVINLSEVNNRQVSRARVAGNLCVTAAGHGIQVTGSDHVAVEGNMLVATGPCSHAVRVHAESSEVDGISVRENDVSVAGPGSWDIGVRFVATQPVRHVSAVDNSFHGVGVSVSFVGNAFTEAPLCALNRAGTDVARSFEGLEELPQQAVVVGGGVSRGGTGPGSGGGRFLAGVGDPNQTGVPGNVGDLYQRLDQDPQAPVPTLYVKETGDDTTTGWSPK